jgi:demethylmenaquinone methyltransferase/2-methoxy-6-polyprenyl-1,4-benzoquinol methylase
MQASERPAPPRVNDASPNRGDPRLYTTNPDATLTGEAKYRYVSAMFARIAARYDAMNVLMSFGQDARWRRYVAEAARPTPAQPALDVATGTGLIARELSRRGAKSVGIDFSLEMMLQGRRDPANKEAVHYVGADALSLPFGDNTFSCVTTGFAMRNVTDIEGAFREMCRVVRPGGRVVCLEVGRPRWAVARAFHTLWTRRVVPLLGRLIAGDADAYRYLPSSMRSFPPPEELALIMHRAGLDGVRFRQLSFGAVAVHVGVKRKT